VWAGLGTCIYFIDDNRKFFRLYRSEIFNYQNISGYSSTVLDSAGNPATEEALTTEMDKRKRWLDLSYFSLVAVYGLNLLDANVDGHLFNYDISPEISMRISPSTSFRGSANAGLSLTLNF